MPRPRQENRDDGAGFPLPFGRRHSLLEASCPARGFRPSYDRPTAPPEGSADPSEVSMFRTHETRLGPDALFTPGTAVPARPRGSALTVACRLSTAGPCHPGIAARPGMSSITGHQQGFTGVHPSQPSPHLWPPDGTTALGLSPGLRTPPGRTRRRTPGRGRASALPEVTSSASLTSSDALTHCERHHVAQTFEIPLRELLA
jgi:hypothetical protein